MTDPRIITTIGRSMAMKSFVCHNIRIYANAIMYVGTIVDGFVTQNQVDVICIIPNL